MGRAPCCDKASVKKGPWSPEEDAKLKAYIEKYGTGGNWIALPQKIGLKRCGKSCRLRWLNYLRPNIKHGGFTEEEDNIICSLYISIGSRWSIIAAQLPGRTDNDIKNYWNTRLKKKLLGRRKQPNAGRDFLADHNQDASSSEDSAHPLALSNSAMERLQLHMQLQRLNSPLSICNNMAFWPKMHPVHEKMIRTLQPTTELFDHHSQIDPSNIELDPRTGGDLNVSAFYNPTSISAHSMITSLHHNPIKISDSVNHSTGPEQMMMYGNDSMQPGEVSCLIHGDHHQMAAAGILGDHYSRASGGDGFVSQENQNQQQMMLDYDCFKGILEGSSSWDGLASVDANASGNMFQGYGSGYSHQP